MYIACLIGGLSKSAVSNSSNELMSVKNYLEIIWKEADVG
jgi:hypothetical protein